MTMTQTDVRRVDRIRKVVPALALLAAVGLCSTTGLADATSIAALEAFWEYPVLRPHTQAHYLSSYDRSGGNDDGFDGTYSALYVDANGEHVIFDERGPGVVYTQWFTSRVSGWSPLAWGEMRYYFDDETVPRIALDANELFAGRTAPFLAPFVFGPFESTGGHVSYVPLPFRNRLKITTERRAGFYNIYWHSYAGDQAVESWAPGQDLSRLASLWSRPGRDPVPPRVEDERHQGTIVVPGMQTPSTGPPEPARVELLRWSGEGTVAALRLNPLVPLSQYQLRHLLLRIWWDDEAAPSVDVPVGHFFGSGLGEASVRAIPLGMSPSGPYYCFLPMPFWRSARIELINENPEPVPAVWWEVVVRPGSASRFEPQETGYFKARYNQAWPTEPGRDYTILETEGRGVYVGQMMTVEPVHPEVKRWWEGDMRVLIDGRRHPALQGTGHEDEYLGGWSNEWLMNPYSLPLHGEPRTAGLRPVDFQWSAATTVYRFFAAGVPYESSIAVRTEHGTENDATASYSSVAYYYERPSRLRRSDGLDVGDRDDESRHDYEVEPRGEITTLASRFEGPLGRAPLEETGRLVGRRSRFRVALAAGHRAVRIRRLYDQEHRQAAEIWVDGERAGVWSTSTTNGERRWADADYLLPLDLTRGKTSVTIEIGVIEGPWTEYGYEVWGIE